MMIVKQGIGSWLENDARVTLACIAVSAICLLASLGGWLRPWLAFDAAWPAIVACGTPILVGAARGLLFERDVTADVLVGLALLASVGTGAPFAAGEVALVMQLGSVLEQRTSRRARAGMEALVEMLPRSAHVLRDGASATVAEADVRAGDELAVLSGEMIPADGTLLSERATLDEAVMTGESAAVDRCAGDHVISGAMNAGSPFRMRAEAPCAQSSLQRMAALATSAAADRAPVARAADRWARRIVAIALACALLAWLLTGQFIRAVTVLVVFCPCAFVLATPSAIAAGLALAARRGVLIRSGESLERLAHIDRVALDKTGTLTLGAPSVVAVHRLHDATGSADVLALAGAAESMSEHPLGQAIVEAARRSVSSIPAASRFETLAGCGVAADVAGERVVVGCRALLARTGGGALADADLAADTDPSGATSVLVSRAGSLLGSISLLDELRPEAGRTVARLIEMGLSVMMLTGDNVGAAEAVAARTGISDVHAGLSPEEKAGLITRLRDAGARVCMVGDGVNDALALPSSYAGISLGGIGSDVAVEASDAVLVEDDISALPEVIGIARRTMVKVRQSIVIGIVINLVAVSLSMMGLLNPVTGALWHNVGSVLVVLNAAALLRAPLRDRPARLVIGG